MFTVKNPGGRFSKNHNMIIKSSQIRRKVMILNKNRNQSQDLKLVCLHTGCPIKK